MEKVNAIAPIVLLSLIAAGLLFLTSSRAFAQGTIISSFTAQPQTVTILVQWTTVTEINIVGFNLYASPSTSGPFSKLNSGVIPSHHPGSISGSSYSFTDNSVVLNQPYYYKLEVIAVDGSTLQFGPVSALIASPPTPFPPRAAEVPEADSGLLIGGGLSGLATWLRWQWRKIAARKKLVGGGDS